MAQRRVWRALQFAAGVVLVGLAIRSVALNWQSLRAQPVTWQFSPAWIMASVLAVFASYAVLIEAWRRVVLSMGERLTVLTAARIWFLASLGKYVPGKVWAVAGAAVLAQRAGVDPTVAVAGAIVLQALALASGAAVVAVTARAAFQAVGQGAVPLVIAVVVLSVLGVVMLGTQPALDRINRLLPASWPRLRAIPPLMLGMAFSANVIAWIGYGVALLLLTRGLLPGVELSLPQAVGVFTCSYLAGFIAVFAPGGLGPRESVFLLMLAGDIGLKPAAALALASRLLLTGTEVLPAIPLLLRRSASRASSVREA
ncbi:MAG TPA: lysylphosphatidylglycerol synthase domain-containing protein [Gemmatimonadales bacterium]|nr:lysylphosphatidylglycerol synthase domain-containing protein [Gemmatimonadales bacterium]